MNSYFCIKKQQNLGNSKKYPSIPSDKCGFKSFEIPMFSLVGI